MSSLCYDHAGNRVTTDILVSGYIREFVDKFRTGIPNEIIKLCFSFWLIDVCDEWDKSLCHKFAEINESVFTLVDDYTQGKDGVHCCTAFGTHSIKEGEIFEWTLRLNTKISWICIGVCPDEPDSLRENKVRNSYGYDNNKRGCFLLNMNGVLYHGNTQNYCTRFGEKDTLIKMTLNMKDHTISYKINDEDHPFVDAKLKAEKYKLAVTHYHPTQEIELM